jgi:hypothetical protein
MAYGIKISMKKIIEKKMASIMAKNNGVARKMRNIEA